MYLYVGDLVHHSYILARTLTNCWYVNSRTHFLEVLPIILLLNNLSRNNDVTIKSNENAACPTPAIANDIALNSIVLYLTPVRLCNCICMIVFVLYFHHLSSIMKLANCEEMEHRM